jgi:hypothetical protein
MATVHRAWISLIPTSLMATVHRALLSCSAYLCSILGMSRSSEQIFSYELATTSRTTRDTQATHQLALLQAI